MKNSGNREEGDGSDPGRVFATSPDFILLPRSLGLGTQRHPRIVLTEPQLILGKQHCPRQGGVSGNPI